MTEQEYQITKAALLDIIQDAAQPARERGHAADTLLELLEWYENTHWTLFGSPVQTGKQAGGKNDELD